MFLGLTNSFVWTVRQLELKTLTLQVVVILSRGSLAEKIRTCETFKQFVSIMKRYVWGKGVWLDFMFILEFYNLIAWLGVRV